MRVKIINRIAPLVMLCGVLLTGIVSCQKDKYEDRPITTPASPPPTASSPMAIKEYRNGNDFIRFEYNTDGSVKKATVNDQLTTDGNTIDYNISYNAQKEIASVQTSANERIVPVYENGKITRADVFERNEKTGFTAYVYEGDRLKSVTLYWGDGTSFAAYYAFIFSYDDSGNLSETVSMMATRVLGQLERVGHVTFRHDNNTNPLFARNDLLALLWQAASRNNIIEADHFDGNGLPGNRYVYTYTYNTDGLPQHAHVKIGLSGQPATNGEVEYIY